MVEVKRHEEKKMSDRRREKEKGHDVVTGIIRERYTWVSMRKMTKVGQNPASTTLLHRNVYMASHECLGNK